MLLARTPQTILN
jgi:hypothetical protein